jgi:F420-non-reducing hydrogenase iron-sulfur subunit
MPKETRSSSTSARVQFEPKIVAFLCNWCTYLAADLAGVSRIKYAPNLRVIRLMCSGRVDAQFVLEAFAEGADGVFVGGCHLGDCHYQEGNYKTLRRVVLLKRLLKEMGIEEERFRLEWISASEADRLRATVNDMVEKVRRLGPLRLQERQEVFAEENGISPEWIPALETGRARAAVDGLAEEASPSMPPRPQTPMEVLAEETES